MQPRKDLFPRLLIVSHVTKRGYFSSLAAPLLRNKPFGKENSEDLEEDLDVSPSVAREGVLDEAEGTEEEEEEEQAVEEDLSIRLMVAGSGGERVSSISSSAPPASSAPAASYCSHSSSNSLKESGLRFSRLLERHSKQ
jgi:hypothetical protein